jgi:hypothetical protein
LIEPNIAQWSLPAAGGLAQVLRYLAIALLNA